MICPVLLPGCFEQEGSEKNFIQAALYVESELEGHRRHPQWSHFILTSDENIELTGKQLRVAASFMDEIMQEGRKYNQDCCCPGCIISDVNEVGQAISLEQKAKIIVLLTVFRNTECENGERKAHVITHDDICYQIFTNLGFSWGGDWERGIKDFQHFEKPIA